MHYLIILRELRNLQSHSATIVFDSGIHVRITLLFSKEQRPAIYCGRETSRNILFIPLESLFEIKTLRNAKCYDFSQLNSAICWFNVAWLNWGITDLIYRGICILAKKVISKYYKG